MCPALSRATCFGMAEVRTDEQAGATFLYR